MPLPLKISCLSRAEAVAQDFKPEITISLLDAGTTPPAFKDIPSVRERLRLFCNDQESVLPTGMTDAVNTLISCGHNWRTTAKMPRVLLHCHGGVSRSTAAAYILMCAFQPDIQPAVHFAALLRLTKKPWPNLRMVELADETFKAKGAMTAPLIAYRKTYPNRLAVYDRLNRRRGIGSKYKR